MKPYNKLLKSDCGKLSPCLHKDANKPPIHHNRLAKRYMSENSRKLICKRALFLISVCRYFVIMMSFCSSLKLVLRFIILG